MCSPEQDAACGLAYAGQVLETGGTIDTLSPHEAPRLARAAGGQLIQHAVLQAQIEDAARVVAASDPASTPVIQRVRSSTAALVDPPREPISSQLINIIAAIGGIVGLALSVLPAFGFLISPWLIVGVLVVSIIPFIAQLYNGAAVSRTREQRVAEHEEAILALLRRADEIRAYLAQQARQSAFVTLPAPAMPAQ